MKKTFQAGNTAIVLLIIIVLIAGGWYFYRQNSQVQKVETRENSQTSNNGEVSNPNKTSISVGTRQIKVPFESPQQYVSDYFVSGNFAYGTFWTDTGADFCGTGFFKLNISTQKIDRISQPERVCPVQNLVNKGQLYQVTYGLIDDGPGQIPTKPTIISKINLDTLKPTEVYRDTKRYIEDKGEIIKIIDTLK